MFGNYLIETLHTHYDRDVRDAEGALIRPFMPRNKPHGSDLITSLRDVRNAIFDPHRTACQGRYWPTDFPPWSTVAGYYERGLRDRTWERVLDALRGQERQRQGRSSDSTAGSVDRPTVKVPPQAGEHGDHGHQCVQGRQRHLLVDPLGWWREVVLTAAKIDDRVGAQLRAYQAQAKFPRRKQLWADSGDLGAPWLEWFPWFCGGVLELVKRSASPAKFLVVPRRGVVERTCAGFDRYRRLSKDDEVLNKARETRCRLAMIP